MKPARWSPALAAAILLVGCVPAGGSTESPPPPSPAITTPTGSPSAPETVPPSPGPSPSPSQPGMTTSRSATRSPTPPEPTPSLPDDFPISGSLLDGGAAIVVRELHDISGFRPALKLDVSESEVTLTVLTKDQQVRSYRWRDGVIDLAETDVQNLQQSTFWPTDFALDDVRRIFDVSTLLGTSSNGQVLQVVEYRPGNVFMSVTTTPESNTIFFHKDGTVFRDLDTSSVADIREGLADVVEDAPRVYLVGFDEQRGYFSELPAEEGFTERRSRMANRPAFTSQRTGTSSLAPFDPRLLDPASIAQTIATHDTGGGCSVEIDNRFERVQPVVTYQCDGKTYHSDLRGTDMTEQLR